VTEIESRSPQAPTEVVVRVPDTPPDEVARAADAARRAGAGWAAEPATVRAAALHACAQAVEGAADELAALVVRDVGKPVGDALAELERSFSFVV
jgi:aldehyde dehydrogenase (NAD+)